MKKLLTLGLLFFIYAHEARASLALDGSVLAGASCLTSTCTVALTTSNSNDVIILTSKNGNNTKPSISGISDVAGLSWAKRFAQTVTNVGDTNDNVTEIWSAVAAAPLSSDTITVTYTGGTVFARQLAFGISGANTSSSFDPNGSLTASSTTINNAATSLTATYSTTNSSDFIFGVWTCTSAVGTCSLGNTVAGFTNISNSYNGMEAYYQIVSSPQSSATATVNYSVGAGSGTAVQFLIDGIQGLSSAAPLTQAPVDAVLFESLP